MLVSGFGSSPPGFITATLTGNTIRGNASTGYGGGVGLYSMKPMPLPGDIAINAVLTNNRISGNGSLGGGGVAVLSDGNVQATIRNNIITGNNASGGVSTGGGLFAGVTGPHRRPRSMCRTRSCTAMLPHRVVTSPRTA